MDLPNRSLRLIVAGFLSFCLFAMLPGCGGVAPAMTYSVAAALNTSGNGQGSVSSSPSGISCPSVCSATFNQGAALTFTATPAAGSLFSGWAGNSGCGGTGTCSFTVARDTSVIATFSLSTATLSVGTSPTTPTYGTITSTDGKINCPGTCSAVYQVGQSVTLTEVPNSASHPFINWTGYFTPATPCSASTSCTLTIEAGTTSGQTNAIYASYQP